MKVRVDLHNHLTTNTDSVRRIDFNKVIDKSKKRLGIGGILGIVSFSDKRYETFVNSKGGYEREKLKNAVYVPRKYILVIKGQEIVTKQGHLLILGIDEGKLLKDGRSVEDSLKEAEDNNGISIVVHPFMNGIGPYLEANPHLLEKIHGIEVHNGESFLGDRAAKRFYEKIKRDYNVGAVSFSDGHSIYEIGLSYTNLYMHLIKEPEKLNMHLEYAIRAHKDSSQDKQHNSYLGALDHIIDMVVTAGLQKLGVNIK